MDITVYLPDEIGKKAKAAELNLSALLREAVTDELDRRERVAKLGKDAEEHELQLENADGVPYTGVLTGTRLTEENRQGVTFFLTDDGRVIAYDSRRSLTETIETAGDPDNWENVGEYLAVCDALGESPQPVKV